MLDGRECVSVYTQCGYEICDEICYIASDDVGVGGGDATVGRVVLGNANGVGI